MSRSTDFDFGANIGWQDADNLAPWGSGTEAGGHSTTRMSVKNGNTNAKPDSASVITMLEITCAQVEKMVHNITITVRKANRVPMANRNGNKKQADFLKAEHIGQKGKTPMKVTGVGYIGDSGYGLKINFNVDVKGKKYTFGIKPTNLSIKTLLSRVIAGKPVMVERDEYDGKEYVKVAEEQ